MKIFKKLSPKATKRFLATLLCSSLVLGISGVNAVSVEFEELEQNDKILKLDQSDEISLEQNDMAIVYDDLNLKNIEDSVISEIDSTENQSIVDMNSELYSMVEDSEFESIESSDISQILQPLNLTKSYMNARMKSTIIDLTDLATGKEISHDCNLYLNTQYDTAQHWKECSVCHKKFNIASHSYKDNGWTGGNANNCASTNVHQFSCSCGYGYTNTAGRKDHTWSDVHYQNDWYNPLRTCLYCHANIFVHDCKKSNGSLISCSNPGTCALCGHTYIAYHRDINPSDIGPHYCFKCGRYLGTVTSLTMSNPYEGRYVYNVTVQVPFGTVSTGKLTHEPDGGNSSVYSIINAPSNSQIWTGQNIVDYSLHEEYKASSHMYFLYTLPDGSVGYIRAGGSVTPESTPPVISNINMENLAYSNDWVTNQKITILGTENYCNTIYITVEDTNGNKYLNNVKVSVSNKNWNYVFYPAIEANETGLEFTVTVKDQLGNTASKRFIEYKTDMKPPVIVSEKETTKEWSKTKDFSIDTTDFGVKNVSIAFNNVDDYQLAEQNENNFVRPYTFTGDVYGSTIAAIYAKDSIGNTATQFITIYNLDNTAPTITKASSERQGTRNAIVTVTANDINTKLNASGSGVAGYAITQDRTVPAESDFQTENTFNLTKSGTWYVWAIDVVGNISEPTTVDVKIEYTVSVNPNEGTLTGDSSYQVISGETITIPEPTRTGYTFIGWTVKGTDSSINNNSFTMGSEDAEIIAQWKINQYPVTYIDKDTNGNEIGRTTIMVDYDTLVRGSDIGNSNADNAYHNQYRYVSDTSATVTTDGATVYRIFEFCETEKESHLTWNDNNDADSLRPEKYTLKLKQNGIVIDEVELPTDTTDYIFDHLPKYDTDGNPYVYEIEAIVSDRYKPEYGEDGSLIFQDYQPANFSVVIPKQITLSGLTGSSDYSVSVKGTFYYNDILTVQPNTSFTLTDRNELTSMEAKVKQDKTTFTKEDNVAVTCQTEGNIKVNKPFFAGKWNGSFNFDIKFVMQN